MKPLMRKLITLLCVFLMSWQNVMAVEKITYYHNDISGSPVAATDANGNLLWTESYQPYGAKVQNSVSTAAQPIGYTGKVYDDTTGLMYFGARYYDPVLGRFTGMDPAEFSPTNIHSFNRYAYGNNNPYRFVDPDGNTGIDLTGGATPDEEELEHEKRELEPLSIFPVDRNLPDDFQRLEQQEEAGFVSALGKGPKPNGGTAAKHGSDTHNDAIDARIRTLRADPDVSNIRKNQRQVDINGNKVGTNRPDIQYDRNECHYCIEYDTVPRNSENHGQVIQSNDPAAKIELNHL